jgi:hypothetical protein
MLAVLIDASRRAGIWLATLVDHWLGWHRLPAVLGLIVLVGIRSRLRLENLTHTGLGLPAPAAPPLADACVRTPDGTFNDLRCPAMGSAGAPLGRNVPLAAVWAEPYLYGRCTSAPSPRMVSCELLARTTFVPAGRLNVLAAAWIQFMIHDWFSHGPTPGPDTPDQIEIPLEPGDPWRHGRMRVPRARTDPARPPRSEALGPTFPNVVTHWWDASQLYGSDPATLHRIRTGPGAAATAPGGRIPMDQRHPDLLPLDPDKAEPSHRADLTGFNENWWIGLSLLHTLFALEHNRICERLAAAQPGLSDEELFAHARLINAAVLAKIHTVEWTPAILDHPTVHVGMRGIWRGLERERGLARLLAYVSGPEVRYGVPGSPTEHHGVPYSITEEFVAVYRMHALLPDVIDLRSASDPAHRMRLELAEVIFGHARAVVDKHGFSMADVAYSLGTQSAGALTLHNFPNTLRDLEVPPHGLRLDLAAVDVLRDRERGVPRYNDLRRLLHRPPVRSFEQLVGRQGRRDGWAEQLRRLYGNVDDVDAMIGLYAEPKPRGFGFSDTAFRIFLFMASRRLKSDRFFTVDFNERVYTREGLDWIEQRTMAAVLRDHLGLATPLAGVSNPFLRWDVSPSFDPMG